jgi:hypothetical protein
MQPVFGKNGQKVKVKVNGHENHFPIVKQPETSNSVVRNAKRQTKKSYSTFLICLSNSVSFVSK